MPGPAGGRRWLLRKISRRISGEVVDPAPSRSRQGWDAVRRYRVTGRVGSAAATRVRLTHR